MKKERRENKEKNEKKVLFFSELGGAHMKQSKPMDSGAFKGKNEPEKWSKIGILSDQPYRSTDIEVITLPPSLSESSGETKGRKRKMERKE